MWEAGLTPLGGMVTPGLAPLPLGPASLPPIHEFLIQDVCLDADGLVTAADPATCPRARNLRIGEDIPLLLTDWAQGQAYLRIHNAPALQGRRLGIVNQREFGANSAAASLPRAFDDFDWDGGDGYDVIEADGAYVAIVGTRDPLTVQSRFFWFNAECAAHDGWLLFPAALPAGQSGQTVASLQGGTECPGANPLARSLTVWERYAQPRSFTSGKQLEGVASFHFAAAEPAAMDHLETFLFTRAYGLSRWERWERDPARLDRSPSGACNGLREATFFGLPFHRYNCRDWTTTAPRALQRDATPPQMRAVPHPVTRNESLRLDCREGCAEPAAHPVALASTLAAYAAAGLGPRFRLQVGLTLWAPPASTTTLMLELWDQEGRRRGAHGVEIALPEHGFGPRPVRFTLLWDQAVLPLGQARLEFTPSPGGVSRIDDVFVAVLPEAID